MVRFAIAVTVSRIGVARVYVVRFMRLSSHACIVVCRSVAFMCPVRSFGTWFNICKTPLITLDEAVLVVWVGIVTSIAVLAKSVVLIMESTFAI